MRWLNSTRDGGSSLRPRLVMLGSSKPSTTKLVSLNACQ